MHNVNLSAKAICGLASFARLCELRGDQAQADEFMKLAQDYAARWLKAADDGDHFRLAFDRPGSWSQKYNIVWDRILGFDLWPAAALSKEMAFHRRTQNSYGLPLDHRESFYEKCSLGAAAFFFSPAAFRRGCAMLPACARLGS